MPQPDKLLNRRYISLFLINLIVSVSFAMVSTTVSMYVRGIGATASIAGTVVGALSIASLCIRPFTGIISDRLESRKLLMCALGLIALAMLGYSLTSSIPLLIALRILHGIGFSVATTVTLALAAGTIPERRMTQGMGYFALGQTVATAIGPTIGIWLGQNFGFSSTFRFAACTLLLAVVMAFLFVEVRKCKPPSEGARFRLKLRDMFAINALPFCVLSAITAGATGLENGYVALFGSEVGLQNVGWYFTIAAVALLISRLFGGRLTDRHERVMLPLGFIAMIVAFLSLGLFTHTASIGVLVAVFASAAACKSLGLGVVQPALQAACMRCVEPERRGAASGTYYLGTDIGQALSPIMGGMMMDSAGSRAMFAAYALPLALAIALYLLTTKKGK